ncbi:DEKNAAC102570 [Brettanomyces naardenensis]|uniref:dynamin GTPase n=1 Tax=Brettanomyces naardenensis TaxID=13370 RepID=A0A448YKZ5_BRENA|nr:DEKNAAC102570 [Brettanomyces naardenensis]
MSLNDLIPVVNRLQDIVANANLSDLDLPLLTVIGSQSAGKSSVLENIVGKDFLPRGTGIVTRRPLILQLINIKQDDPLIRKPGVETDEDPDAMTLEDHLRNSMGGPDLPAEWGEFLHLPGKRFYNFQNAKREIERETARVAGKNKGISRIPINLKVYSPNVLNLTLVDLPGLTKIPVGDQPTDIERQIKNLVLEYISKPNSIILAVSPANVDLVNSEALKLARQVDPQGKRTIGILSKLDLMDHGTNALDILVGKVYPLKLGFIGVVNRSQQDISTNKSLKDSLAAEQDFFISHPAYRRMASHCGTEYLAKTLNRTLMNHIRDRLPDIKAKLNTLIGQTEQELATYGDDLDGAAEENRGALILQLLNRFSTCFISSIEGNSSDISTKELCGGARIYYVYNEVLGRSLRSINPLQNLTIRDIRTAIRNSTGPRPSLFVPELAFDLLVKPQIQLLEGPAHRCVELVYEELMKIGHGCGPKELARYPKLHARLIEVVSDLLRDRLGPTFRYVESLIDINRAYINTNHPDFVGAAAAMASVVDEKQRQSQKQKLRSARRIEKPGRTDGKVQETNGKVSSVKTVLDDKATPEKPQKSLVSEQAQKDEKDDSFDDSGSDSSESTDKDTFLNFFFGKDASPAQQKQAQDILASPQPPRLVNHISSVEYPDSAETSSVIQFHHSEAQQALEEQMDSLSISDEPLGEREQMECELIRRLIVSYFGIVRQTIQDQVPKAIMCLLVNYCKDAVQNTLVQTLYRESLFDELLYEDETLSQEREKCRKLLDSYKKASVVINEVV